MRSITAATDETLIEIAKANVSRIERRLTDARVVLGRVERRMGCEPWSHVPRRRVERWERRLRVARARLASLELV